MRLTVCSVIVLLFLGQNLPLLAARTDTPAGVDQAPENCTSIMVTPGASVDGASMTSHSCDSNTDRTWMNKVPRRDWPQGAVCPIWHHSKTTTGPDDHGEGPAGTIPQVSTTWGYLNAAYPIMNEHQLAIGETTIGGRKELKSDVGLLDAPELFRLCLERARTAREAIHVLDELTREYGYIDWGESFTFADPGEVWLLEVYGPGEGRKGAVWAAQRIPDGHVSVSANASRLRHLDLDQPDSFLASANVLDLAREKGWWKPEDGPFEFCYAYAPDSRTSLGCRRREWRVLGLLAAPLKLAPPFRNHPLSVAPDKKVDVPGVLAIFRDTYRDTPFDMTRDLMTRDREGNWRTSPVATPFMGSDTRQLLGISRERLICSPTCTYLQITQSRSWLPNPVGGVVWLGYDNPAAVPHVPIYIGTSALAEGWMRDGRRSYGRDCAWWAFRTVAKLAQFRWQEMEPEIRSVWTELEKRYFDRQPAFEREVAALWKKSPSKATKLLTRYTIETSREAMNRYWELADGLWVRYGKYF